MCAMSVRCYTDFSADLSLTCGRFLQMLLKTEVPCPVLVFGEPGFFVP